MNLESRERQVKGLPGDFITALLNNIYCSSKKGAKKMIEVPQVVTIAGIDSSGGAGINADLKTFHSQKVYSATIVVGLTAQNTLGVQEISSVAPHFILSQFDSVFSDLDISAAKTGALFDVAQVKAVITGIKRYQPQHLVVDPVMVAKGGTVLLSDEAMRCIKRPFSLSRTHYAESARSRSTSGLPDF